MRIISYFYVSIALVACSTSFNSPVQTGTVPVLFLIDSINDVLLGLNLETGQFDFRYEEAGSGLSGLTVDSAGQRVLYFDTIADRIIELDLTLPILNSRVTVSFSNAINILDLQYEPSSQIIYYTQNTNSTFSSINQLTGEITEIITSLPSPTGIAFNSVNSEFYIAERTNDEIIKYNLNTQSDTVIANSGISSPDGIVYIESLDRVCWTDGVLGILACVDSDGLNQQNIHSGLDTPRCISYSPQDKKLYWTEGSTPNLLKRSDVDGSSIELMVAFDSGTIIFRCEFGLLPELEEIN